MNYSEQEYRRRRPQRGKRRKQHFFLNIFVLILAVVCSYFVITSSIFDVKSFTIESDGHFTTAQIIEMSGIPKGENIFKVRVSNAEERLEGDPYIKSAQVKWDLPDNILITIEERTEDILVESGENLLVLNFDGTILLTDGVGRMMPVIVGLTPKDPKAGKPLSVNEADLLKPCLDFFRVMNLHDLPVKKLDVTNFVPRAYILDTLYVEGAMRDIENSVDDLKKVIADLLSKGIERGKISVTGTGTCSFAPENPAVIPDDTDIAEVVEGVSADDSTEESLEDE